jgi:hypothetical protein
MCIRTSCIAHEGAVMIELALQTQGHHFSCDYVSDSGIQSFRFTCRASDYRWVLDRNIGPVDGVIDLMGTAVLYNTLTVPAFPTISSLLQVGA